MQPPSETIAPPPSPKPRGGARPGAGRKKGSVSSRRLTKAVVVRLRDDDALRLAAAADELGWTTTRLVRSLVHERIKGRRTVLDVAERTLFVRALHELRRQGANLNQIAFCLNCFERGITKPASLLLPEAGNVAAAIDDVRRTVQRLQDYLALGRLA